MRRLIVLVVVLLVLPAQAQRYEWPSEPKNLQVLEGVGGERLADIMKSFTVALGVRCVHCHEGEEGQPLTTYDFASDARPNKQTAREMMRMMGGIDAVMETVQQPLEPKAEVGCVTCHRGERKPTAPADLMERLREERSKGRD